MFRKLNALHLGIISQGLFTPGDFETNTPVYLREHFGWTRFKQGIKQEFLELTQLQRNDLLDYARVISMCMYIDSVHDEEIREWERCLGYKRVELLSVVTKWLTNKYSKRNTLVIQGVPNTGKSLFAQAFGSMFNTAFASSADQGNDFYFSQFNNRALAVIEEPFIIDKIVNTFKIFLAGQTIQVNEKQKRERVALNRIPVLITSNDHRLGKGRISQNEEHILAQRCLKISFEKMVEPSIALSGISLMLWLFDLTDVLEQEVSQPLG